MKRKLLPLLLLLPFLAIAADRPNIIYLLADDLGIGDVQCFFTKGKIATPNMDRLARGGMKFTDAHSGSAVCTPTRYGIVTGRFAWRTHLQNGVLHGFSPPLIPTTRLTVAEMLHKSGYATAAFGKWHLGLNWKLDGKKNADWSASVEDGPVALGFESYYGIAASLDMPPFIWINNDHVVGAATATKKWLRSGPAAPEFEAVDVLPTVAKKTCDFIAAQKADKPFFAYVAFPSPHTPIEPTPEFRGKSGLTPYADYVMETDWAVGKILDALDTAGFGTNTLVIMTSDNGCSPAAGIEELRNLGHDPCAGWRGNKADIFEGGHRIPFVARWPAKIKAGSECADTITLTDFMATAAELSGAKIPETVAEDSTSIAPDLFGAATKPVHDFVIHHSINGSFAIRQGLWKLCLCPDSGGWSGPKPGSKEAKNLPPVQLFNLADDPAETKNLQGEKPELVKQLTAKLEELIANGRTTPGAPQKNDVAIKWRRGAAAAEKLSDK